MFPVMLHRPTIDVFLLSQLSTTVAALIFGAFSSPTVYHFCWLLLEPFLNHIGK